MYVCQRSSVPGNQGSVSYTHLPDTTKLSATAFKKKIRPTVLRQDITLTTISFPDNKTVAHSIHEDSLEITSFNYDC